MIEVETRGRVTTLTINRPDKRNAITQAMYGTMADALTAYADDDAVRALIVTGAEAYFTSGNDIGDFALGNTTDDTPPVIRFLDAIASCPKPLVAAVNGPAIGVGVTMLLHCDVVVAADSATFNTPFAQLGLVPEAASSLLLPRAVGTAIANDMLMANRTLTATEALRFGLISRICAAADLEDEARRVAGGLANAAPQAMRHTKALIRQDRDQVKARMQQESVLFSQQLQSAEFAEVVAAKMQKRAPVFK